MVGWIPVPVLVFVSMLFSTVLEKTDGEEQSDVCNGAALSRNALPGRRAGFGFPSIGPEEPAGHTCKRPLKVPISVS